MDKKEAIEKIDRALAVTHDVDDLLYSYEKLKRNSGFKYVAKWTAITFGMYIAINVVIGVIYMFTGSPVLEKVFYSLAENAFILPTIVPIGILSLISWKNNRILKTVKKDLRVKNNELEKAKWIPEDFLNTYDLTKIRGYWIQERVESMKEAYNLLLKEEFSERRHEEIVDKLGKIERDANVNAKRLREKLDDIDHTIRYYD